MKFFPLVFSIFMLRHRFQRHRSHSLQFHGRQPHHRHGGAGASWCFCTVLIYGFYKNGLKFFKLFVP